MYNNSNNSAAGARLYLAPHVSKQKKQVTNLLLHLSDDIANVDGIGFTITLDKETAAPVKFNWWIVEEK